MTKRRHAPPAAGTITLTGETRTLIFPHQLFDPHPALEKSTPVLLLEDSLFFGQDPHQPVRFHQHKLMLHRAAMSAYAARLDRLGYRVNHIKHQPETDTGTLLENAVPPAVNRVRLCDPVDYLLERRIRRWAARHRIAIEWLDTPMFLTPPEWFQPWFDARKRYAMADFYSAQRKRLNILVDAAGKPLGGRWSFDTENRRRWPSRQTPPLYYRPPPSPWVTEAATWVNQHHPDRPGSSDDFWYPVTHEQARASLHDFLAHRFHGFGDYEDAIALQQPVLHHSVLTSALNCGLLTPHEVLEATLDAARDQRVPLNDTEGFIRQIIGWREFMRIIYVREGIRQRTANFWNHQRTMTRAWYDGTTGLDPIDQIIRRTTRLAYAHHIERLMVLGNAMLLTGLHPDQVYRWFMELFIDAYDWVMVPNVYGMSQYADGGLITTKPYLSGSNYLRKMSDAAVGPWCEKWDGLYWRFIARHREFFAAQPRLAMMARLLDNMNTAKRDHLFACADAVTETITGPSAH